MGREEFQAYFGEDLRDWAVSATQGGIADSRRYPPELRRVWTESLKAHVRSDHINFHAERLIADTPGIGVVPRSVGNKRFYLVGDRALATFKKLDDELLPRGILTRQARAFLHQLPLPELGLGLVAK